MLNEVLGLKNAGTDASIKLARELAQVVPGEDTNLALHSEICARRFSALVDLMVAGYDQSRANRLLLLCTIALLVLTKVVTLDALLAAIKPLL